MTEIYRVHFIGNPPERGMWASANYIRFVQANNLSGKNLDFSEIEKWFKIHYGENAKLHWNHDSIEFTNKDDYTHFLLTYYL